MGSSIEGGHRGQETNREKRIRSCLLLTETEARRSGSEDRGTEDLPIGPVVASAKNRDPRLMPKASLTGKGRRREACLSVRHYCLSLFSFDPGFYCQNLDLTITRKIINLDLTFTTVFPLAVVRYMVKPGVPPNAGLFLSPIFMEIHCSGKAHS